MAQRHPAGEPPAGVHRIPPIRFAGRHDGVHLVAVQRRQDPAARRGARTQVHPLGAAVQDAQRRLVARHGERLGQRLHCGLGRQQRLHGVDGADAHQLPRRQATLRLQQAHHLPGGVEGYAAAHRPRGKVGHRHDPGAAVVLIAPRNRRLHHARGGLAILGQQDQAQRRPHRQSGLAGVAQDGCGRRRPGVVRRGQHRQVQPGVPGAQDRSRRRQGVAGGVKGLRVDLARRVVQLPRGAVVQNVQGRHDLAAGERHPHPLQPPVAGVEFRTCRRLDTHRRQDGAVDRIGRRGGGRARRRGDGRRGRDGHDGRGRARRGSGGRRRLGGRAGRGRHRWHQHRRRGQARRRRRRRVARGAYRLHGTLGGRIRKALFSWRAGGLLAAGRQRAHRGAGGRRGSGSLGPGDGQPRRRRRCGTAGALEHGSAPGAEACQETCGDDGGSELHGGEPPCVSVDQSCSVPRRPTCGSGASLPQNGQERKQGNAHPGPRTQITPLRAGSRPPAR